MCNYKKLIMNGGETVAFQDNSLFNVCWRQGHIQPDHQDPL